MRKKAERDNRRRVNRGGGWSSTPARARVANRGMNDPGCRFDNLGFRLVRHRSALEWLAEALREVSDEKEG